MTDKERLGEVKSEPFANLEKLKVDILQVKICSGLEDFEQDSKRQWTSLRFEKPLLVKLLSLIKQAERVQELETTVDFYQSALRDADRRVQELEEENNQLNNEMEGLFQKLEDREPYYSMKCLGLEQQNKRYREAIKKGINATRYTNPEVAYILAEALEGEE